MVNPSLKQYLDSKIIPQYEHNDLGHNKDHIYAVIDDSLELAKFSDSDENMVYTIACYHDIALPAGREEHHLNSAKVLRQDQRLLEWFSPQEIEIMAQAIEDHRASSKHVPRSIYGKIIAEADRQLNSETIIYRTLMYGLQKYPQYTKEEQFARCFEHFDEKYSEHGYLHLYLPYGKNQQELEKFWKLLKQPTEVEKILNKYWRENESNIVKR